MAPTSSAKRSVATPAFALVWLVSVLQEPLSVEPFTTLLSINHWYAHFERALGYDLLLQVESSLCN